MVFPPLFIGVLQGIATGIGISHFLRAFFMMFLKSSSSGLMKKIPRNFPALSSFGFSIAHCCFAFRFDASDMCFHISSHTLSGLEVVPFLVSLSLDYENPTGGLSFNEINLVKPVHASDISRSASTFQQSSICFSINTSSDVCVVLVTSMYLSGI